MEEEKKMLFNALFLPSLSSQVADGFWRKRGAGETINSTQEPYLWEKEGKGGSSPHSRESTEEEGENNSADYVQTDFFVACGHDEDEAMV